MPATGGVRIAVDAMGGDHGAAEVVPGAVKWAREHPADAVILVGDVPLMQRLAGDAPGNVTFVHGPEVVGMDEHPARALARKKLASIRVATELVKNGEADAVITAGHTGAGFAAGKLILGTLPGIDRPALAVQLPGPKPFLILDIGANPDSTAENLAQYARMGSIFAEQVMGVTNPRVALLSIGEEKGKGDARIARATALIDETDLNFIGNVEGRDLTRFVADVVVCDAVVGNVVIKFFEGLSMYIFDMLKAEFLGSLRGKIAGLLMKPSIARIRGNFDYEVVGGSPLLGVRGTLFITHGSARRRMIWYAVDVAAVAVRGRVTERIAESLGMTELGTGPAERQDALDGAESEV
ncbi:MAG: phosphate acyltransferase PlsX [Chloroflexota bacterium]